MTQELEYTYTFSFDQEKTLTFRVSLNPDTLTTSSCPACPPSWAKLTHHQCQVCSLSEKEHLYCPIALNLTELLEPFKDVPSYTRCTVCCISPQRIVSKDSTVQDGLASILGLLMAASECPAMSFFRPLVKFHLPFATVEESIYRVAATYCLRKFFSKESLQSLDEIQSYYKIVAEVNRGILSRIKDVGNMDADKNAMVTLNSLAQILELELETELESLQPLFS